MLFRIKSILFYFNLILFLLGIFIINWSKKLNKRYILIILIIYQLIIFNQINYFK